MFAFEILNKWLTRIWEAKVQPTDYFRKNLPINTDATMSQDEGDDLNFNELVGNLLSTHNAGNLNEEHGSGEITDTEKVEFANDEIQNNGENSEEELLNFNVEGDDDALAAVVASAIQNMDQERAPSEDFFPEDTIGNPEKDQDQIEDQQQEEWARILQQGLLQNADNEQLAGETVEPPTEQLDQDDENLRRAILESLQELNVDEKNTRGEKAAGDSKQPTKKSSKKSSKKKKKDKPKSKDTEKQKSSSSKKKKQPKDQKKSKHDKNSDSILTSDDVIRELMQHEAGSSEAQIDQETELGDAETHALVEATLKAFERELLGPAASDTTYKKTSTKKKTSKSTASSSTKKKALTKESTKGSSPSAVPANKLSNTLEKRSKKDKKKGKRKSSKSTSGAQEEFDDDEFSRALADMVNQVVNTSLTDVPSQATEETSRTEKELTKRNELPKEPEKIERQTAERNDDSFDLNQIMQKAMAMAFQEQHQEGLDTSVMEDFNRGLGDFGVANILGPDREPAHKKKVASSPSKSDTKKDKSSKQKTRETISNISDENISKTKIPKQRKAKPQPNPEELLRKRYFTAAKAAASKARKLMTERNRAIKIELRTQRKLAREEKKERKREKEEELAKERKELEEIVAKGPPYPPDLRLTKSGKPKRPYRRWTKDELTKREAMLADESNRVKKVKKPKKRKSKKLKRVPLSALKRIPLFNFIKSKVPSTVDPKLNGINESLKKIPLQSYKLDINRLAPPEKVTKEEMANATLKGNDDDLAARLRKSTLFTPFDISRKTVIRREKIPFHPPWKIPSQPPFALPVARRRRKEKGRKNKDIRSDTHSRRYERDSSVFFNARNKIIPAVLFPIINTLKAAAKAKAASGASPEEASRHLMTIIKHTKNSIAQTLALSRKHSRQDYSTIKNEKDILESQEEKNKVRRIPLFSLTNIKKIEAKERASDDMPQVKDLIPSIIKIEDDVSIGNVNGGSPNNISNNADITIIKEMSELGSKPFSGFESEGLFTDGPKPSEGIISGLLNKVSSNTKPGVDSNAMREGLTTKTLNKAAVDTNVDRVQPTILHAATSKDDGDKTVIQLKMPSTEADISKLGPTQTETVSIDQGCPDLTLHIKEGNDKHKEALGSNFDTNSMERPNCGQISHKTSALVSKNGNSMNLKIENNPDSNIPDSGIPKLSHLKNEPIGELPALINGDAVTDNGVRSAVETLLKEQFSSSNSQQAIDLPSNFQKIISATIGELIPELEKDHMDNKIEEKDHRKRARRTQTQVLNLDGLVPPTPQNFVPKINEMRLPSPIPSPQQPSTVRPKYNRKRSEQPTLLYTFDVPDFKETQGKRVMLLKRAKEHLKNDDMNILKKEMNKERKRKWREANTEKNWENDLRARLKRRSTLKFGDSDSEEKRKWFEIELNRSLADRNLRRPKDYSTKKIGSTNLSDNEVLNMIATTLGKLDVARILERELNDEAGYKGSNITKEDANIISHGRKLPIESNQNSSTSLVEKSMEGFHEDGTLKRPYPDDIPVIIPISKRPAPTNNNE